MRARRIFAHEGLVRGTAGEPAASVLSRITASNRYAFDQACRDKVIQTASRLQMGSYLSINFLPNAIYRPELCIRSTLRAARRYGFPVEQIIFETAIDDFGAGFAGLTLLADFQPDIVKLDMALIRAIDQSPPRRAIVAGVVAMCRELGIELIAEGIETADEARCLADLGIGLMQGYWFGRPQFERIAHEADIPWVA